MSTAELASSYAALILADDGVEITVRLPRCSCALYGRHGSFEQSDKLQSLITAAKVEDVEPIWTSLFAKVRTYDNSASRNSF